LISLEYFRNLLILATAWQRQCNFRRCIDCRSARAISSTYLPSAELPQRTLDVPILPVPMLLTGVAPLFQLGHCHRPILGYQASTALPGNPALAGK
jgi:hypothetical protein